MIRITLDDLEKKFGRIAVVATDLRPVAQVGGIMYLSEVQDRFNKAQGPDGVPWLPLKFPRPQGGAKPLSNTGLLRQSYTSFSTPNSFGVGTNAKQARLLHFGGTVRPTNAKALTIPLTREAIYAGKARNMPGLFVLRGRRHSFLARRESGSSRPVLHWLLTDSVKIEARPQVGVSLSFMDRYSRILVDYLRTGRV